MTAFSRPKLRKVRVRVRCRCRVRGRCRCRVRVRCRGRGRGLPEEGERHVRGQERQDEVVPARAEGVDDRHVVRTKLSADAHLTTQSWWCEAANEVGTWVAPAARVQGGFRGGASPLAPPLAPNADA